MSNLYKRLYPWIRAGQKTRVRQSIKGDSSGFTLIELALSMVIFIAVMTIATFGFIGMVKTVQRGLIQKQLSEAVQLTTDELTKGLRGSATALPIQCDSGSMATECQTGGHPVPYERRCFGFLRFSWQGTGLYEDNKTCDQPVVTDPSTVKLMDDTYTVRRLRINPTNVPRLYEVEGVFSTSTDAAFLFPTNPDQIICKGTETSGGLSRTCALEKFKFIVSTRIN